MWVFWMLLWWVFLITSLLRSSKISTNFAGNQPTKRGQGGEPDRDTEKTLRGQDQSPVEAENKSELFGSNPKKGSEKPQNDKS